MRKALILLATVSLLVGCATTKAPKYDPTKEWQKKKSVKEVVKEAHTEAVRKAEEAFIKKVQPKPKAKVEMSSVEVVSADWNGVLFKRVGDIKLRFSIREGNGLGVEFYKYHVRVICTYSGLFGSCEATRTGTFFFQEPLKVEPSELKEVFLNTSTWVSRTANSMDRVLKVEEYRVYVTLTGKDDYENTVVADSESAPL